jgi:hypothetical protein
MTVRAELKCISSSQCSERGPESAGEVPPPALVKRSRAVCEQEPEPRNTSGRSGLI